MRILVSCLLLAALTVTGVRAAESPLDPATASAAVRRAVFRAEAAHDRGEITEAVHILATALAAGTDSDHPSLRYRLGAFLLEDGQPAAALEHLQRVCNAHGDVEAAWLDYARAAYETETYETAADAFARAYEIQQGNAVRHGHDHDTGHGDAGHGDADTHDPAGHHAGHHEADPRLMYYSAVSWVLADRPVRAVDALLPLVVASTGPVPIDWVQALVSAAAACERPARVDPAVDRLLQDHPTDQASWLLASQQAQLGGDLPTAAVRQQVADWIVPLGRQETRRLAELYAAAGVPRMAARVYARLWPQESDLARPLAVSWLQAQEPDSARVVIEAALTGGETGGDKDLWSLLGDLEYGCENWLAAQQAYARAVAADPQNGRAWLMQGTCALKRNDTTAARRILTAALERDKVATDARRLLRYLDEHPTPDAADGS